MKPPSWWHRREHRTASEELVRWSYTAGREGKRGFGKDNRLSPQKKKDILASLRSSGFLTTTNEANLKSVFIGAVSNILC